MTCAPSIEDPLEYRIALPWTARYYPMGVPVDIETNSAAVLRVAEQIWGGYPAPVRATKLTGAHRWRVGGYVPDCRIRSGRCHCPLSVDACGSGRSRDIVQGTSNFAVCDLRTSFAFARLTRDVACDSACFRYHFLEPAVYVMINARILSPLHASCVELNQRALGILRQFRRGQDDSGLCVRDERLEVPFDDATHIVSGRADHAVAGRPLSIRFRETARNLFPELKAWTPERRPNGKLDLEIETSELGIATAFEARACGVVFLNRQSPEAKPRIDPYPAAAALEEFSRAICFGDDAMRADQTDTLRRFTQLPIMQLTYGNPDSAERVLRALVS